MPSLLFVSLAVSQELRQTGTIALYTGWAESVVAVTSLSVLPLDIWTRLMVDILRTWEIECSM